MLLRIKWILNFKVVIYLFPQDYLLIKIIDYSRRKKLIQLLKLEKEKLEKLESLPQVRCQILKSINQRRQYFYLLLL